ncbi:hypothetical protein [Staphylococcus capitis]|uniref:hypothetical protein n=1 Tax=Staphylococcus capitis TaxID=29388 RepID=UPI00145AAA8E|nr:hypothetical protein [Staphylococcus capitis]NMK91268.1 hypothetical protein [Staphylococcus capitis]
METKNYLGADKARHDAIVILITLSIKCFNYQCLRHFRSNDDNDEQKYGPKHERQIKPIMTGVTVILDFHCNARFCLLVTLW